MSLAYLDVAVARWFRQTFDEPTACQLRAWSSVRADRDTLVAAPTGSGKTLAAFLIAINDLAARARQGTLESCTQIVYVSPLKALSNDVKRNLEAPLSGIRAMLGDDLPKACEISAAVRTGDTSPAARAVMRKHPPHILVTTPESLYVLLTSDSGRAMLATVRTVIIDEIHAVAANKRGAHLSLSLARLDALAARPPLRIGLSATQRPISRVADFLFGEAGQSVRRREIIDEGHVRARDIAIDMPKSPLETVISTAASAEIHTRIAELIGAHRTTLVFVNTRRMTERVARALAERLGEDAICAHHGSMSKERRLQAEQRLKNGELKALVATASLELGIDIGNVDLVCQLGATRSLAVLLQRIGRSGHVVGGVAKGRLFPQTRDELIECMALLDMLRRDELDAIEIPVGPVDVLAQQIVAEVACADYALDELYALCTRAYPYRSLTRADFAPIVAMLAEGFSFAQGRRSAYLHLDAVNGRVRARKGARLAAITCGGAIPDNADYDVVAEPQGQLVGTVNEDFAIESLPGNIFQLGNTSSRVLRVESAAMRVEDAAGEPPNMPFWFGEAPARSSEFSHAVSRLRGEFARRADADGGARDALETWLCDVVGVDACAARQAYDYLMSGYRALGGMPTQDTLIIERFFDESGGMQLVIHSPFGSRINKAWGLALRKRFCRTFNFELQAAATEDAIVISLGAVHSFALDEVWRYLRPESVAQVLAQAVLDVPIFTVRWRWVATCALAIQRFRSGRKVAPRLQRMNAEDLAAVVFPDQLACAENLHGQRAIPDHPLVAQTLHDCLHEAMDIKGLERELSLIINGGKTLITRDLTAPSPFALAVLNANPYAFLDDAPLEERRTQAVASRRWLDPATAEDLGALDAAAIERVRDEAWPQARNEDELHEAALMLGVVFNTEIKDLVVRSGGDNVDMFTESGDDWLERLYHAGRLVRLERGDGMPALWFATERRHEAVAVWPRAKLHQSRRAQGFATAPAVARDDAVRALLRSRMEMSGPQTAIAVVRIFGLGESELMQAMAALEASGSVLRGMFVPGVEATQWCDRRLLARIHRYTLNRLRQEIEPVASACYMRFLLAWQYADAPVRLQGVDGLAKLVELLAGFEAPAAAWEAHLLPARMQSYDQTLLDQLVTSGRCVWLRLSPKRSRGRSAGTLRTTPIAVVPRPQLGPWLEAAETADDELVSANAAAVRDAVAARGASFFDDIVAHTGLLRTQCEDALDELAAAGLVTCDSFAGLRALTLPQAVRMRTALIESRRPPAARLRRRR